MLAGAFDPSTLARQAVLETVNRARAEQGLPPLLPDPLLERVGNAFCQKLLTEGRSGHFASDGVAPYLRYLLAGGTGFHRENVGSYQTTGQLTPQEVPDLAVELTLAMLAEKPPEDGHRRTLLHPHATHLGVGLAWSSQRLVLSHEVATNLGPIAPSSPQCPPRGPLVFAGRLRPPWQPAAVEALWEPLPGRGAVPSGGSYRYPPRRAWFEPTEFVPGTRVSVPGPLAVQAGGGFRFRTATGPHEGVELYVLWARRTGSFELEPAALAGCLVLTGPLEPSWAFWIKLREGSP